MDYWDGGLAGNCWVIDEVGHASDYGHRALAVAATLRHIGLQAKAYLILCRAYYDRGDYPQAVESLGGMWRYSKAICAMNVLALMALSRQSPGPG